MDSTKNSKNDLSKNGTKETNRERFRQLVKKEGHVVAAAKLRCSVTAVLNILSGKRQPGIRIACAIEEVYKIPVKDWITTTVNGEIQ